MDASSKLKFPMIPFWTQKATFDAPTEHFKSISSSSAVEGMFTNLKERKLLMD